MAKSKTITHRANAPKSGPDPAESLRRQTAALNQDVALLKASQAADDEAIDFDRLYSRWLHARAAMWSPDAGHTEEQCGAEMKAVDEAARTLLATPFRNDDRFWKKWEVFEGLVTEDAHDGQAIDNRVIMALGCIKADLLHFVNWRPA